MLSPLELPVAMVDQMSTELPKGKTIIDVFADFMRYLFDSTKALFKSSEPNGKLRWDSISESIELVLTHPNGWGGRNKPTCETPQSRRASSPIPLLGAPPSTSSQRVKRVSAFALPILTQVEKPKGLSHCLYPELVFDPLAAR
jgi:hypothetical protein